MFFACDIRTMSFDGDESPPPPPPPTPPPFPPAAESPAPAPPPRSSLTSAALTAFIMWVILESSCANTSGIFDCGATGCVLLSTWGERGSRGEKDDSHTAVRHERRAKKTVDHWNITNTNTNANHNNKQHDAQALVQTTQ